MNGLLFIIILIFFPAIHEHIHMLLGYVFGMKPEYAVKGAPFVICKHWPDRKWKQYLFNLGPLLLVQTVIALIWIINSHRALYFFSILNIITSIYDIYFAAKVFRMKQYPPVAR